MQRIALLYHLIFAPKRFITNVTNEIMAKDRIKHPEILLPGGEYPHERMAGILKSVSEQTKCLRSAFAKGLITTSTTIMIGLMFGISLRYLFGIPSKFLVYGLQAFGAAIILGATLAEVGGDIVTWDKESIPEQLNQFIFHGLYAVGTFLFVTSVVWDAA